MWLLLFIFMTADCGTSAAQLLQERLDYARVARQDLITFAKVTSPLPSDPLNFRKSAYRPARHHRYVAEALMKVERGEIKRLHISLPYRHGKTEIAVRKFAPFYMGRSMLRRDPKSVIVVTYADTLASEHGRDCREVFRSNGYRLVFGQKLRDDSQAMDRLQLQGFEGGGAGPCAQFSGRGGLGGGFGANLIIFDDFFKNAAEARSPATRESAWQCFNADCSSRLNDENGAIIIIGTRKHADDVQGRLFDPENEHYDPNEAARWTHIILPALAEEDDSLGRPFDEPLWPERFGFDFWNAKRTSHDEFVRLDFQTQAQCKPTPEEGSYFKKDWLCTYEPKELPPLKHMRMYGASDHAYRKGQKNDRNCLLVFGVDASDVIWILPSTWWERSETDVMVEKLIDLMQDHNTMSWWAARDAISGSIAPFLRKRQMERKVFNVVDDELREDKDLERRAQSIRNRMAMGMVRFPKYWPKWGAAERELLNFPNGKHDDLVAALAIIGMKLDHMVKAHGPGDPGVKKGTFAWHSAGQEERRADNKKW
jgi:hypothetical protein